MSSPVPTTAGMPRDALHREQFIQAALALMDEGGIESLTMRRLGSRLGSTTAALYWQVKSRHGLLLLAADTVWGRHLSPLSTARPRTAMTSTCSLSARRPASPGWMPNKPPRASSRSRSDARLDRLPLKIASQPAQEAADRTMARAAARPSGAGTSG